MKISIQFSGVARAIVKAQTVDFEVEPGATYTDVVRKLSEAYPQLTGVVIDSDGKSLLSANMFSMDGEEMIQPDQMEQAPAPGARLMLMSIIVGG